MGADGFIRTPAENTGKRVDATETINGAGLTVYRLRMDVPGEISVRGALLELLLLEIATTNAILAQGFGLDVEDIRNSQGD